MSEVVAVGKVDQSSVRLGGLRKSKAAISSTCVGSHFLDYLKSHGCLPDLHLLQF